MKIIYIIEYQYRDIEFGQITKIHNMFYTDKVKAEKAAEELKYNLKTDWIDHLIVTVHELTKNNDQKKDN